MSNMRVREKDKHLSPEKFDRAAREYEMRLLFMCNMITLLTISKRWVGIDRSVSPWRVSWRPLGGKVDISVVRAWLTACKRQA